jgi:hypothetical protein
MLARPQEDEGRPELCFVATSDSFAHTLEQAPAAFRIAKVRRRSGRAVDEGIAEGDEPGAQRMNLVNEVRGTLREARVASRHPVERGERLSGAPYACRACDERPNALHVRTLRGSLGKVLAKGVVETVDSCGGCPRPCRLPVASGARLAYAVPRCSQAGCDSDKPHRRRALPLIQGTWRSTRTAS